MKVPLALTATPVTEPTAMPTPVPTVVPTLPPLPTATPLPEPTPEPTEPIVDISIPPVSFADPYVRITGCVPCVAPGGEVLFEVLVGNYGNADAVNVQVDVLLPQHLSVLSVVTTQGAVLPGSAATIDLGTVRPETPVKITLRARMTGTPIPNDVARAVLRTTSLGNDAKNDGAVADCPVCVVTLPTTGAAGPNDTWSAWALLMVGMILMAAARKYSQTGAVS